MSSPRTDRIARPASPCPRFRWCAACSAASRFGPAGGVHAGGVAQVGRTPGLVQRGPHGDSVTELAGDMLGVVCEPQGGLPVRPAAGVLQFLRQVPVVQGRDRLHAGLEQGVDQSGVPGDALGVECPRATRLDPRPGEREPVGLQAQVLDQSDVLGPPVVVVVGDIAGVAVQHLAGGADSRCPRSRVSGRPRRRRLRSGRTPLPTPRGSPPGNCAAGWSSGEILQRRVPGISG